MTPSTCTEGLLIGGVGMQITLTTTENDLSKFLHDKFAYLSDDSATEIFRGSHQRVIPARGRPRDANKFDIYEKIRNRVVGKTVDNVIVSSLSDECLIEVENIKRASYRQKNRTHHLLDEARIYDVNDFSCAVLAKRFDVAAAIFVTAQEKTKQRIIQILCPD